VAAWSALPEGESVSTVDLRVDFLEPGRLSGPLRAEARLVRKGNRVCHVRVALTQDGTLVAEGVGVYNIHRRKKEE
jgi:acyl-coenzyme A thioesterase PaaI-like protein